MSSETSSSARHAATAAEIRARLEAALSPSVLELVDESYLHAGHAGAKAGGGHFRLRIVAAAFTGKSPVARQRLIYEILGNLFEREIHALSMRCLCPAEVEG